MNQVAYIKQKFMCHGSLGWEVQDRGAGKCDLFLAHRGHLVTMSSHGERSEVALQGLFYQGTNSTHEDSTFIT